MRRLILGILAVLMMVGAPMLAGAVTSIDFSISPQQNLGAIFYGVNLSPNFPDYALNGYGIVVDTVTGLGTPNNASPPALPLVLQGATLDFSTGQFINYDAVNKVWDFAGGGFIQILGGFDPGTGLIVDTLLAGSFTSAQVMDLGGSFKFVGASFVNYVQADLAKYFGLPGGSYLKPDGSFLYPWTGNLNLSFNAGANPVDHTFGTMDLYSGSVNASIPEPGTMMLLGSGLVGLAGWGRKKFRR